MESRVLVLYTGGTIGMQTVNDVYKPVNDYLLKAIRKDVSLNDSAYVSKHYGDEEGVRPCALPPVRGESRRILYWLIEYEPLLDSSDVSFREWMKISKDIQSNYEQFDGFVVLHGTDTLCFTASALSFCFENLGKPIVLTGSQIPISEVRCDGRENLVGSLIVAANYDIPEVTIFFNSKLFRGNRTTKIDCNDLNAFDSPNFRPLAKMGVKVKVHWDLIYRSNSKKKVALHTNLNQNIAILRLFPNMPYECFQAFFKPPIKGVVLQTFGGGNMPSHRTDIIDLIKNAVRDGLIVVNCSQCQRGSVDNSYHTSQILYEAGVLFGADMTVEAALTKLAYVLGKDDLSIDEKKAMLRENLRGELTLVNKSHGVRDHELVSKIATSLNLTTTSDMKTLRQMLYPPLICQAASDGNLSLLKNLKEMGILLTCVDYLQRSPLHYAASSGHDEMVTFLLEEGVSVFTKDSNDCTPLIEAVNSRQISTVQILRDAGAHLTLEPRKLCVRLTLAVTSGDLLLMQAWRLAGANLSCTDYDGRNALHVAASVGNEEMIEFLMDSGVDPYATDLCGHTALDKALINKRRSSARLIRKYLERRGSISDSHQ